MFITCYLTPDRLFTANLYNSSHWTVQRSLSVFLFLKHRLSFGRRPPPPRTISMAVGQPINRDRVAAKRPQSSASGNGLTSSQKTGLVLVAALCGPALLKKWYEKPASEKVDLSGFNIVTAYDTPAIERMDSTVRIEFCSS